MIASLLLFLAAALAIHGYRLGRRAHHTGDRRLMSVSLGLHAAAMALVALGWALKG